MDELTKRKMFSLLVALSIFRVVYESDCCPIHRRTPPAPRDPRIQ